MEAKEIKDAISELMFEFKRVNWLVKILAIIALVTSIPFALCYSVIKLIGIAIWAPFKWFISKFAHKTKK